MFPGMPPGMMMDPSQMSPETIAELTALMRELPMPVIQKMQTLMHNAMAGFPVQKEMEEFERDLPPGFREKLMQVMLRNAARAPEKIGLPADGDLPKDAREARLVILHAVASGQMTPEEAEPLLR